MSCELVAWPLDGWSGQNGVLVGSLRYAGPRNRFVPSRAGTALMAFGSDCCVRRRGCRRGIAADGRARRRHGRGVDI